MSKRICPKCQDLLAPDARRCACGADVGVSTGDRQRSAIKAQADHRASSAVGQGHPVIAYPFDCWPGKHGWAHRLVAMHEGGASVDGYALRCAQQVAASEIPQPPSEEAVRRSETGCSD
jgi:hypothetical protein